MQPKPLRQDPDRLEEYLKELPISAGVYLMRDALGNILYIGKSKALRSRVRSYFRGEHTLSPRIAMMTQWVTDIEFIVTDTEAEALALEDSLIKRHQPHYNILLKDDKKYPYLCITWSEQYPRLFITRKRSLNDPNDRYYGPYVDAGLLRYTLGLVKRLFPLRQRSQPLFKDRPCLNYDIGRCPGVCQQLISSEDYHKIIKQVALIFQGRTQELEDILTAQMEKAAQELRFEQAAQLRDQLRGVQTLTGQQKVALPDDTVSRDAIALAQGGDQACVQVFQVRSGRLVGRLGFVAQAQVSTPGLILERVLEEHYWGVDPLEIPGEILVQHPLPQGDRLQAFLSQRRGRKVEILVPQRQQKAELIALVERNAEFELARTQRAADRVQRSLEDLAQLLDLPALPQRIEGYDISHIQGSDAVASQVVFLQGVPAKHQYRRYRIKNPQVRSGHSDDFASLAEVLERRCKRLLDSSLETEPSVLSPSLEADPWPDLLLIDGGKGQLSAVVEVLQSLNLLDEVRVISLAKKREEVFLPGESDPLETDPQQPALQLLRQVRDEAHRFAVSFHRQRRSDRLRQSRLDDIPGLGLHRQKQLLAHFPSVDYIRQASLSQLKAVPGIGPKLAETVYEYFHPTQD